MSITHKLFLDDSGNKEYEPSGNYAGSGRTPYFVFGGLIVTPDEAGSVSARMESLKIEAFGQADVEVKANWLKRPTERQKRYLDPFGVSDDDLSRFTERVYDLIVSARIELLACVVNKQEVQQMYGHRSWYAPAIAYECVIQRLQLAMEACGGYAHVTIDDMEGGSPKGRAWKDNLTAHHGTLLRGGSRLKRGMTIDRVVGKQPSFRDSAVDDRIQLADLVAYAVYRQFVDYGPEWEAGANSLPTYSYFERLAPKFRNQSGRIQGYGIVKFPMGNRIPWGVA
jgi:hypothetical protein